MAQPNDLSRSLIPLCRENTLIVVVDMSQSSWLDAHLLECCRRRMADSLRGHDGTIGEWLKRDLASLQNGEADLRAASGRLCSLSTWPSGVTVIVPQQPGRPESVVKVERV